MIPEVSVTDLELNAKMVHVSYTVSERDRIFMNDDQYKHEIKKQLALMIADYIVEKNLIEFTKYTNLTTLTDTINARCCLLPDNQVKKLRLHSPKYIARSWSL